MDNKEEPKAEKVDPIPETVQSASDDLKKVASKFDAARQGFSLEKLFVGRLDQKNYLYIAIGGVVIGLVLMGIPLIGLIAAVVLCVLGLGASARRLHDINMTGWASLLMLIPFIGILAVIYLCWKVGDAASNTYGTPPDKARDVFKALLNT